MASKCFYENKMDYGADHVRTRPSRSNLDYNPVDTMKRSGRLYCARKIEAPNAFAASIRLLVLLLALNVAFVVNAQSRAKDDSYADLFRQFTKLFNQRKFKEALPLAEKLVDLTKRSKGEEDPDTAADLSNLGAVYENMCDFAKAEPLLKKALVIHQKVLGREHPDTAVNLNTLGELYQNMGDYAKAEPLLKEALAINQKVLGLEDRTTMVSLLNLGFFYQKIGEYTKAEPLLKECLATYQKVLGPEHLDTATILGLLADLELDLGEVKEASRLNQAAYALHLKMFYKILSFGSEDQRLSYQNYYLNPYTLFAALNENDALAGAVLHCKGVVLDSIIEDRLVAETSKEDANRVLVQQLDAKKRMLAQLSLQTRATSPKEASERIQPLEQEVENIEGKLARQGTDVEQARRALTITVEQVQAAIPNDAVLVEYVRYSHHLAKFK